MTVINIGNILLTDIPNQMRKLADSIEEGNIDSDLVYCVIPQENSYPLIYGWGRYTTDSENIAIMELAKSFFVHNIVTRSLR